MKTALLLISLLTGLTGYSQTGKITEIIEHPAPFTFTYHVQTQDTLYIISQAGQVFQFGQIVKIHPNLQTAKPDDFILSATGGAGGLMFIRRRR